MNKLNMGLAAAVFVGLAFGASPAAAAFIVKGDVLGQVCNDDGCAAKAIDVIKGGSSRALRVGGTFKDVTEFDPEAGTCRVAVGAEAGLIAASTKFLKIQHDGAEVVLTLNFVTFNCIME